MTYPGSFISGDVLTASDMNGLPGGVNLGGVRFTESDQTGITTATDVTGSSKTITTLAGRAYKFTVRIAIDQVTTDGTTAVFLNRGGSDVHYLLQAPLVAASGVYILTGVAVDIPGAGSFAYKVRVSTTAGTVTLSHTTSRGYMTIEDIGPLSWTDTP